MDGDPHRFDYERLHRFLDSRGARAECPVCGANSWSPFGPTHLNAIFLQGTDPGGGLLTGGGQAGGLHVYCLTCTNCAYVRLHNAVLVNKHVDD